MPAYVTETVIWTFVIAFVACMAGGVLMVLGFWEPKDPAVRKWLFRGVVGSVVGAVVAFGIQQFSTPPGDGQAKAPAADENRPAAPAPPVQQPRPLTRPERDREVPPDTPVPQVVERLPDEVRAWAETELGPRPVLSSDGDGNYPSCVARLRSRESSDVSMTDARGCRRELQQFHMDVVVAYYEKKRPYDRNLEAQEAALRRNGLQTEELPKYNYILAEMERLNGEDSAEANALHALEQRLLDDIRRCSVPACR